MSETSETFEMVLPDIPVNWHIHEDRLTSVRDRIADGHPLAGFPCLACGAPLGDGEPVAMLVLGPGADPEARAKCHAARWFAARSIVLHAACAGV